VLPLCRQLVAETQTPVLSTLAEGYQLISARLQRMLSEHRIERLTCLGRRVDPTRMKVIELVDAPDAAPETVVDELRPGYVWRGQVVRYAEVRATRAVSRPPDAEEATDKEVGYGHDRRD
jgi:molecular chaperone GrpE